MRLLGVDVGEKFARRTLVRFRPCRNFQEANYGAVAGEMATALAESCIADEVARASVRICLDELAENVPHHADAAAGGFAAAQGWPKRGKFEVGIVDLGIGVASSLRKNPDYAELRDDARAVRAALGQGVTSNPDRNAGIGLFITKRLLRLTGVCSYCVQDSGA